MAPSRKCRSGYKRVSNLNEVSPDKDSGSSKSGRPRKKKLSDMLGPQWSHEELERFYEAYRKHGKEWKRVAAVLKNRSVDMVEALYNMNKAYLSLPEGMASVVGLKAMMTDHYNVMEGTDSEQESIDAVEMRKLQKRKRAKVQQTPPREDRLHSGNDLSNDGCLSLLKKRRIDDGQPRAVGKRTPRIPVASLYKREGRENYVSTNKRVGKLEGDSIADDVAHEAALALAVASNKGGSPQVSRSPFNKAERMKASPIFSWERTNSQSGATKCGDASLDEELIEGSIGSAGTENGEYARDTRSLKDIEGVGTIEVHQKVKKPYRKKEKLAEKEERGFDDGGEACSATEEGDSANGLKRKVDVEAFKLKRNKSARQVSKKRNKKLSYGDEDSAFSALQTLADLSLMMPVSAVESESSVQLKEDRGSLNIDDKTGVPEATSITHQQGSPSGSKDKGFLAVTGSEKKKSKPRRPSNADAFSLGNEDIKPTIKTLKRKWKSPVSKLPNDEVHTSSVKDENVKSEAAGEEGSKSATKGKRTIQVSNVARNFKTLILSDIDAAQKGRGIGPHVSTAHVHDPLQIDAATRHVSRRKKFQPKILCSKEKVGSSEIMSRKQLGAQAKSTQDKLSCWLSSPLARRWCIFEWFYSAIDYPWFAKREFMEYLNHVGLGHIPRLTRVEWSVIRSSLGKPRRFSENFLSEERKKLEQYRESVRKHYAELRTGARDGLPADLARPLSVGQRVIALHPKTRELHDGSVLTVDHGKCRVQFDRPDIGVEFVMDVDCMPVNPVENMPEALRRHAFSEKFSTVPRELQMNGNINFGGYGLSAHHAHSPMNLNMQGKEMANALSQSKESALSNGAQHLVYSQSLPTTHIQDREADIQALSNLTRALDKQEALILELRNLNNDAHSDLDGSLKDSESFKKHYATVLVQLKEAGGQAASAMVHLRERNTYAGNSLPPWLKMHMNSGTPVGLSGSVDRYLLSQELDCNVLEIVDGSRLKARAMVDTAIKAVSSLKEGEDAYTKIAEEFDSINERHLTSDPRLLAAMSPEKANGSIPRSNHSTDNASSEPDCPSGLRPSNDKKENQVPEELITSCVATLFMIQTCTERHYPPSDVARILDSAVSSLHPCCPENLPIYREIQMSMGRLKIQILALVPTQI